MKCQWVQDRFSPWIDGELAPFEEAALRRHLADCAGCRTELEEWTAISRLLRSDRQQFPAPAGLAAAVLAQLPPQPQPLAWWRRESSRRWLAAVASFAILASGAVSMLDRPTVLGPNGPTVGIAVPNPETPGSSTSGSGSTGATNPDSTPAGSGGGNQTETDSNGSATMSVPPNAGSNSPERTTPSGTMIASGYQAKQFLSADRVIQSTLLKLAVADPADSYRQIKSWSGRYDASVQVLVRQATEKGEQFVLKLLVPAEQEAALTQRLTALGAVTSQTSDVQDVTANFQQTLEEYRNLANQLETGSDPTQTRVLTTRFKELEKLLATWEQEAQKRVIVVWLEP